MEIVLFIVVFIGLWLLFYCKLSLLPMAQLRRAVVGMRSVNELTREFLLEIANCAVAAIAALLIASVVVWYAIPFE